MLYVRTTKTASSATAVQIIKYKDRRKIVVKHIGSAHNAEELLSLKQAAQSWIEKETRQIHLFPQEKKKSPNLIPLDKCKYLGFRYAFIYEVIGKIFTFFKFSQLDSRLFVDLALMRIIEPCSKLESLELLKEFFGIEYQRRTLYRQLPFFVSLKNSIEEKIITFAKNNLNFDFSLVFYDVTTLYFETFKADELRKQGFSKDNKSNQPQIVIGLVVNRDGYPIKVEVFEGNKFEGHTMLPVIKKLQKDYGIDTLTVVADAAMLSFDNIQELEKAGLNYIVGARLGNISTNLLKNISNKLSETEGVYYKTETQHGILICDYLYKRAIKDRSDRNKQLVKANFQITNPQSITRKSRFVKETEKFTLKLNEELIAKDELREGIKGYYTNLKNIEDSLIVSRYKDLWHVEKSFRIAKSDLEMRPVYHFKEQTIHAHILICFMALSIVKFMEIRTGKSIKSIIKLLKSVTDARLLNMITNEEIALRSEVGVEIKQLLRSMEPWY